MKVLLVNTYAGGGGAAVAVRRLWEALNAIGVEARMLVVKAKREEHSERFDSFFKGVVGQWYWKIGFAVQKLQLFPHVGYRREDLFRYSTVSGEDISRHPWVEWAEVIHLHWLQHNFVSLSGIESLLTLGKPVCWSLHDLWPITGGCHIPYFRTSSGSVFHCTKYHTHCQSCPILSRGKRVEDLSFRQYQAKLLMSYPKVHFLAVSEAVAREVRTAAVSRECRVSIIPNMIDPRLFYPKDQGRGDTFRILFVAARPDDPIKGLGLLEEVLNKACERSERFKKSVVLDCVGHPKKTSVLDAFPIRVNRLGSVSSPSQLATLYHSARVTISTSLYETFGQTMLESIACGTPSIAFAVGGIKDIIDDGRAGFLIPAYDTDLMADRLLALFDDSSLMSDRRKISQSVARFYSSVVAHQVLRIYKSMIEEDKV